MRAMLKSKNLIPFPYHQGQKTANGVTFTPLLNGEISIEGKPSTLTDYIIWYRFHLPEGTYHLSDGKLEGIRGKYRLFIIINHANGSVSCVSSYSVDLINNPFTVLETDTLELMIRVETGYDGSRLISKPMLNEGLVALPYQPYFSEYQGIGRSKNLFNEDILVEYGAEKLASGEYYFKYSSTPFNKIIWENTENYQGQLVITFSYRYILNGYSNVGAFFNVNYTDGTKEYANITNIKDNEYSTKVMITNANKTISNIYCSYGSGGISTYLKNIMINYGTTALPYQPYLQRYNMYMYDNLIKLPYFNGNNYTHNGITFTIDEQTGWIIANGTSTGQSDYWIKREGYKYVDGVSVYESNFVYLSKGKYVVKGSFGGTNNTYFLRFRPEDRSSPNTYIDINTGYKEFEALRDEEWIMALIVKSGAGTVNNLVFKPELIKLIGD